MAKIERNSNLKKQLRALGLPDAIADPNWEEIEAKNMAEHARMLERLREFERLGYFEGMNLPWTKQREAFEADVAQGIEYPFFATQNNAPVWKNSLNRTLAHWQIEGDDEARAVSRAKAKARHDAHKDERNKL